MKRNCTKVISSSVFVLLMVVIVFATCNMMGYAQIARAEAIGSGGGETVKYYTGTTATNSVSETVTYARYEIEEGYAGQRCPQYYNMNTSLTNTCAPVGGAIVVGFYDRYYTDLIPNVTPGFSYNGVYYYYTMATNTTATQGVINSLYSSMGTNSQEPGTSRAQYQAGLTSYVTAAGYHVTFTSVMNGGTLDNSSIMNYLSCGTLVTLYITNHNLCSVSFGDTSATYTIVSYTGLHIYIAYKYRLIKYYNSSNVNFRTDILLGVSTGFGGSASGWYYVGYSGTHLDDADATDIF